MRLLLINDDPRYRALVRHHVTCVWPDADVVSYNPVVRGPLQPGFLAQGYDAVLLDQAWKAGDGLTWLAELTNRPGFAPVIFLLERDDDSLVAAARAAGAFDTVSLAKVEHERLIAILRAAAAQQSRAIANWRSAPDAREQQTFGGAYVRGYRRVKQIASGSVSDLYLAESHKAGALVVLKVTRDARRSDGVDQAFARFLQEYEIVRGIRHPNVVHLHDLGVTDDYAYLVMEYFARGDLRARVRSPVSPRQTLDYMHEIAGALDAIHKAGILHRDLKPGNVMVRDDGSLALIDFGLAKHRALELEITDKGLIFGTPYYMSPEQGHGQPTDPRSDLYALGIMLYEMLTARKPFDGDTAMGIIYKHAKEPIPQLPAEFAVLQPLLERLMAKRPDDRYPSARAVLRAIEEAQAALPEAGLAA
jgi:tRNA A-37 threonylcarbamoyl transferase component Bud32/DNA-binding response OmpR family regulator